MPTWDDPRMDPRMDPRQRPMTGEMPQVGYGDYPQDWDRGGRDQGWPQERGGRGQGGRDQGWPQDRGGRDPGWPQDQGYDQGPDQRWMEASHDGGGRYADEPQWDGGYYPDADPRMQQQYDEPGYPPTRGQRYGGDRY
jgi:hypothetical protein